jgi:hypothetical protein
MMITDNKENDNLVNGAFFAVLAAIFFGTFAVPMKQKQVLKAKVDPVAVRFFSRHYIFINNNLSLSCT